MKHLQENIDTKRSIDPVALGTTGAITGRVIDRKGYGGVEFIVYYGAITTTGTNVAAVVKEGDATGSLTSVADGDLLGTETLVGLAASTDRTSDSGKLVTKRIGYKGTKRYCNITLNHTGTTSVGIVASAAILHTPEAAPVANP